MDHEIGNAHQLTPRHLCRFYTKPEIGSQLIGLFGTSTPSRIVDLGTGDGCLALAAANRWRRADITTVDIDPDCVGRLNRQTAKLGASRFKHFVLDALNVDLPSAISADAAGFDTALCNPPYIKLDWRPEYRTILEQAGLMHAYQSPADVTIDALFMAQIMRLTKAGGRIGLIVPDTAITGKKTKELRRTLLTGHTIDHVVQLPRGSFSNTDAQAFLITFRKGLTLNSRVRLSRFLPDSEGPSIQIGIDEAIERMDFNYHSHIEYNEHSMLSLQDIGAQVARGKINSAEVKKHRSGVFHTTDFPDLPGKGVRLTQLKAETWAGDEDKQVIAQPGDILVARVDRALHRKIAYVIDGQTPISDCVFRVRVEASMRKRVLAALASDAGNGLLASISRGVSARMVSKIDLLRLPLPL